jgi:SAM-dependent methyltransferase
MGLHLVHIGNPARSHDLSLITVPEVMVVRPNGLDRPDGSTLFERIVSAVRLRAPAAEDVEVLRSLQDLAHERADYRHLGSLVGAHQYARLYQLVRAYVQPAATVLDWGVGNGHFSFFLVRAGYHANGYSLVPQELASRLDDSGYRLFVGDPRDPVGLPFADETFDAVCSVGVLEHVRETGGNETASLREIHRILKPSGIFICYHFPNRYSWIDVLARVLPSAFHHTWRYTQADIRRLVEAGSLDLVDSGRYGQLPRNPLRLLPGQVANSERFARAYDLVDEALGALLPALCQNHYFVARRPAGT